MISQGEAYAHIPAPEPCCAEHAPFPARCVLTMANEGIFAGRANIRMARLMGTYEADSTRLEAELQRAEEMRRHAAARLAGRPHIEQTRLF